MANITTIVDTKSKNNGLSSNKNNSIFNNNNSSFIKNNFLFNNIMNKDFIYNNKLDISLIIPIKRYKWQ